jgi:plastocyanin
MAVSSTARPFRTIRAALRAAIVGLALGTAYIHSTLGGPLFTLNAIGYSLGALAMVVPIPVVSRYRWVVRVALAGYAASTIIGWAIQGPFYTTAYVAKAVEVGLIGLLTTEFIHVDGSPIALIRRELRTAFARLRGLVATLSLVMLVVATVAACAGASGNATPPPPREPGALTIAAKDLAFSASALTAPANEALQIVFDNEDGAPHNVAIYRDMAATDRVFGEEPFGGPRVATYTVPALAPGTYLFRCDVHPDMKGTLSVG